MLKTVEISRAKKTKGIAVTYRAGKNNMFGTCPSTCKLNDSGKGTSKIDQEYLDALLDAVPRKGVAFTYTHFHWIDWAHKLKRGKTVINYSADNLHDAAIAAGAVPTVTVVNEAQWQGKKSFSVELEIEYARDDVPNEKHTVVRCPAEYRNISCAKCGNGEPFCARLKRDFIIGFTAHGPNKRKAADENTQGGCYGAQGNCRIWWNETSETVQDETDAEKLKRFVSGLPPRSIIRHHVAGDIGK
tara:strand:+ start:1646 stop:2377 length:732 start_codon:yes stop_codon:yes gene_type:complete